MRRKLPHRGIGLAILGVLLLSFFGHTLLFSNLRLLDFSYRELSYRYVAEQITNATDSETITRATVDYVNRNVYLPPNAPVIDDDPWDVLLRGNGYCDQLAQLSAALLNKRGIPARWIALRNASNDEPHAVLEVLVGNRWEVFDPLLDFPYRTAEGQTPTVDEICAMPTIVTENPQLRDHAQFTQLNLTPFASYYCNPPRRLPIYGGDRTLVKRAVIGFLNIHYALFGERYAKLFQLAYLKRKLQTIPVDKSHYFLARQNQLYGGYGAALAEYRQQIEQYPATNRTQRSLLFSGQILCRYVQEYDSGIAILYRALNASAALASMGIDWTPVEEFHLGRCYELNGQPGGALSHYARAAEWGVRDSAYRFFNTTNALANATKPLKVD